MPPPGGDVIGRRRLDPHLDAFRELGASLEGDRDIELRAPAGGLRPGDVVMDEPSVMATENALMAAALTPGTTIIRHAACEPHVQDLARMLVKMGADIQGIGSNVLTIAGADRLHGCEHEIAPDHIEIGSFMALAGVTGGELRIHGVVPDDLRMIRLVFARLGLDSRIDGTDLVVPGGQELVVQHDVGEYKCRVQDGPWPAFPADLTSIAIALCTQSRGSVLIHEWMFENRLIFTDKLRLMGADIEACDPHRVIVTGPRRLRGRAPGVARHPGRDGDADGRPVRRRRVGDRQHPPDRSRLRADRRAPARTRGADRARGHGARSRVAARRAPSVRRPRGARRSP